MKRTLLSTLVITSTLGLNANVFALGMGELELKSTLNQPLQAEIELTNIDDLTEWEIKPSLASDGDFDRAGVEKIFFLSDIDFEVKGSRIILSSDKSVTEPFLNFLVQVNWPSGRVLREYTLLLDPPLFDETIQPLAPIATAETEQAVKVESQQVKQPKSTWETEEAKPGTYKVQPSDTLWEIAIKTRPNRQVSPQQMMLAIQDSNPSAFMAGNINRLKTHQVLRIPNEQQMAARNDGQAISEVMRQNKELQTAGAQLDATRKAGQSNKAATPESGGELKLLANNEKVSNSAGASVDVNNGVEGGGRTERLENDLSIALENLDTSRLENDDLKKRLDALEEQIATLQRLVSLKDDQLASIQTLDIQKEALNADQALVQTPELEDAASESLQAEATEAQNSSDVDTSEGLPVDTLAVSDDADFNYAEPEVDNTAVVETTDALAELDPALTASQIEQQVEDRYKPKGFVAEVMAKPELMAGLAGGLALIFGLVGYAIKKRRDNKEGEVADPELAQYGEDYQVGETDIDDSSLDNFEFDEDDQTVTDLNDDLLEGIGSDHDEHGDMADDTAGSADLDSDTVAQAADIIGEAEIYIAYGRFDQAADLLKNSIVLEPSRTDLRMKLLEVYVETDDADSFAEAELELNSLGDIKANDKAATMRTHLTSPINGEMNEIEELSASLDDDSELDLTAGATADDDILDIEALADSEDEFSDTFADSIDFEAALELPEQDDLDSSPAEVVAEDTANSADADSFAASLDALDEENSLEFDLTEAETDANTEDSFDFELTSEDDIESDIESLNDLDDIPTLEEISDSDHSELKNITLDEEISVNDLSELDDVPTLDELTSLDESSELSESDEPAELSLEDSLETDSDNDVVNLAALDSNDSSDMAQLEELLDSTESNEALPDLNFELEETGFENDDLDDLKSLEEELDQLSNLNDDQISGSEEILDSEDAIDSESALDLDKALDLDVALDNALTEDDSTPEDVLSELVSADGSADSNEISDFDETSDEVLASLESDLEGFDANSEFDLNELDELPDFTEGSSPAAKTEGSVANQDQEIDLDQLAAADDEFDFLAGTDECATKLDLARAYMDMEDSEGAKELLQEVISEGNDQQKHDARALMDSIG